MNVQETLLREKIDPALTDATLSALAREALASAGDVSGYEVLTGGCWNRVIAVRAGGRDLVVKISPHERDEKIIREFQVLKAFRERTSLPVPEPLTLDADARHLPGTTLVMSRIPGTVMHGCFGRLDETQRDGVTEQIARHVAELHTIRGTGFGGVELAQTERCGSWAEFYLPRFDGAIDGVEKSGVAPQYLVDGARAVRPGLPAALEIGSESVMTHYDIWSGNVMLDLSASPVRVSGYIDIPGYFADFARELSFAMLFGLADHIFFATYAREHDIDPGFELRVAIYNLKMNLRHVQMYPGQVYYQAGAEQCLRTIEKLL